MSFDAIAYLTTSRWQTVSLGLTRTKELLAGLGNPQDALHFVHVAGTNGKGSTCAFIASVLEQAGYRVGLFTSPALYCFEERIKVDGEPITQDDLQVITLQIREVAEAMDEHPTEFELLTALAFSYFAREKCDIVVVEVGLGGRLDSTNVIKQPEVTVITPISLDHCELLGDTLEAIAREKAGIIKPGVPVVIAAQDLRALAVIEGAAKEAGSKLFIVDPLKVVGNTSDFSYKKYHDLQLGLVGSFQLQNAACALETLDVLQNQGWTIPEDAIREGMRLVCWPGRFEVVCSDPLIIFDGAHNESGMKAFVETLGQRYPESYRIVITGVLADKDYASMARILVGVADQIITITPENPRALEAKEYAAVLQSTVEPASRTRSITFAEDIQTGILSALELAREKETKLDSKRVVICVCGSLTIQKSVMDVLRQAGLAL